jgi:hypothetical protein
LELGGDDDPLAKQIESDQIVVGFVVQSGAGTRNMND